MVIATNFEPPTEGIRHRQANTQAFIRSKNLGMGTLLISESRVCWSGEGGSGFSLEYPAIQLHAVSRDLSLAPRPCLYLVVDGDLLDDAAGAIGTISGSSSSGGDITATRAQPVNNSGTTNLNANGGASLDESAEPNSRESAEDETSSVDSDSSRSTSRATEIRFIPPVDDVLVAMYAAMCECQALHPDPIAEGDEESGDEGEEYDVEEAEQNLGIQRCHQGNGDADEPMEGQFDDAD